MGKLARVAVDGEAENKLTAVLKDTKKYTAYGLSNDEADLPAVSNTGIVQRILGNKFVIGIIALLIALGILIWFVRRGKNRS